jgi:hypothetical protein
MKNLRKDTVETTTKTNILNVPKDSSYRNANITTNMNLIRVMKKSILEFIL